MTHNRAQAVAAWTTVYEADPHRAHARILELRSTGVPEGHTAEWLGACLALTPHENRCAHWGDKTNCTQCLAQQIEAEDTERRERELQAATEARLRRELVALREREGRFA